MALRWLHESVARPYYLCRLCKIIDFCGESFCEVSNEINKQIR